MSNQSSEGTPILVQGRIVWAVGNDLFKGEHQKDDRTKQLRFNQDGSPKMSYGLGLALTIESLQPGGANAHFWPTLLAEVAKLYPNGTPQEFAWKYKDGNTAVDREGKPYRDREGYADCIVLSCTTTWPVKFFVWEQNSGNIQVNEGINPGDYVNVQLSAVVHAPIGQGKPGVYLNPLAVQLVTKGKPIVGKTVNPDTFFGNSAPALPPGVVPVPLSSPTGQQMLVPTGMPGQQPVAQPAPHYGVLPGQHQPQAAPMPAHHQQPMPTPGMPVPGQPMGNAPVTTAPYNQQQSTYPGTAMPGYAQPAIQSSHNGMPMPGLPQPGGMPNFPGMTR